MIRYRFMVYNDRFARSHSIYFNTGINFIWKRKADPRFIKCLKRFESGLLNRKIYDLTPRIQVNGYVSDKQENKLYEICRFLHYDWRDLMFKGPYYSLIYEFGKLLYLNRYKLNTLFQRLGGNYVRGIFL